MAALHGKGLWVGNPGRISATIAVSVALPSLLAQRGWRIGLRDLPADGARMKPREQRLVTFDVHTGAPFTKADAEAATERDIVVTVTANDAIIGGMVYKSIPSSICRLTNARPRLEVLHDGGEMELVAWKDP